MGFGFRVGVPGMSVRVSTRGVRTSVGPRAARISVGSGGTRISSGLGPFYASSSLSGGRRRTSTSTVASFRKAFTPKHATGRPVVRVSQVPVQGTTAVVPAKDITVGGQPLSRILVTNSSGFKPGQVQARADVTRIRGTWYVSNSTSMSAAVPPEHSDPLPGSRR